MRTGIPAAPRMAGASLLAGSCLLAAIALSACGDDERTVTCGPGTIVVAGRCEPEELPNTGPGTCADNTFGTDAGCVGKGPIGAACEGGNECLSETCLGEEDEQPGGYCSVLNCNERRPCPSGSRCVFAGRADRAICLATCDTEVACRGGGYACQPLYTSPGSVCAARCDQSASDNPCGGAAVCDSESGTCMPKSCSLAEDDPCDQAQSGRRCVEDRLGLGNADGLCLAVCELDKPTAACWASEVCQPLPGGEPGTGVCASPLCTVTSDCPAGASCMEGVCLPPAACEDDDGCADGERCVASQCLPACPSEDGAACSDLHPGLVCEQTNLACLPIGAFPGSPCGEEVVCQALDVDGKEVPMECVQGQCAVVCEAGGNPLCEAISSSLSCASGVSEKDLCLPDGSYPGGPCAGGNTCDAVDLDGKRAPMACVQDRCAIVCDSGAGGDTFCNAVDASLVCAVDLQGDGVDLCLPRGGYPGGPCGPDSTCDEGLVCEDGRCLYTCESGGDGLCSGISSALTCAGGIYATPVCLPNGSYPGGPCGPGDTCAQDLQGVEAADMVCRSGRCAIDCDESSHWAGYGDALCATIDPGLTCAESGGDVCVPACQAGMCPGGFSCLDPGTIPNEENACLPNGSFPGSRCASGDVCAAVDLPSLGRIEQVCLRGTCAFTCPMGTPGDMLCQGISSVTGVGLTCADVVGACVIACQAGNCGDGYSCLTSANACLPDGSFPGSACKADDSCDDLSAGGNTVTQTCIGGTCLATCPGDDDGRCQDVDASLTCNASNDLCVPACQSGNCPGGFSCLASQNACLPNGTFPGSACKADNSCDALDVGGNAVPQACVSGTCVATCSGNNDGLCGAIDSSLTCNASNDLCVPACQSGMCPTGYACLTGEDACLPNGSFPGSPCASGDVCFPLGAIAQVCTGSNTCAVDCSSGGDGLCSSYNAALTCEETSGICLVACPTGDCPTGSTCVSNDFCAPM